MSLDALEREGSLLNIKRLGTVTTQIYQVKTALDVARAVQGYDIETVVAGNPSDSKVVAGRTVATYHSEVANTIRAAHNLRRVTA